ncbi:MAG: enoyl-CoA hydratase [Candidatus Xenobia bacterium]
MITTRIEGTVGHLVLDHPPLNILTIAMLDELDARLAELEKEPLRALVLETPHRAFSAGADVGEHMPEQAEAMLRAMGRTLARLLRFPAPTLAVVNGACMGGGLELMLVCDLVVAAENARFALPEIRLGVFPPLGIALLPRLIPPRVAWELIFTGATLDAARARELGLVNRVAPPEQLDEAARELTASLASLSGSALRQAKKALHLGQDALESLQAIEELYLKELMAHGDAVEGLRSFLEKRQPVWSS